MKLKIKNILNGLDDVVIGILLIAILYFTILFMLSWHTLDSINNIRNLADYFNISINQLSDQGGDGISRPLLSYYIPNINKIKNYYLYSIVASLILGYMIGLKHENGKRTRKEN